MTKASSPTAAPMPTKSDGDWRAESDHRTLMESADIQNDPGRMKGVNKHHKKQMKKMSLVQRNLTGMSGPTGGRR